ncbi:hypothetical protein [Clostridium paraputrificum]|uniref:hypothetical protein n=1 Tax=Clostridium paraputrificum TaxID=29363 RepID=UPI0013793890|nr:hypothetical protein [Clostridium paraputrificum]MDB2106649.1 hypothetical protein [Clostridium paraputrificum]MDB2113362.1 hypothetical protein [Clostridium paraputrificum]
MMNVEIGEIINIGEMQVESFLLIYTKVYKFTELIDYISDSCTAPYYSIFKEHLSIFMT